MILSESGNGAGSSIRGMNGAASSFGCKVMEASRSELIIMISRSPNCSHLPKKPENLTRWAGRGRNRTQFEGGGSYRRRYGRRICRYDVLWGDPDQMSVGWKCVL